MQSRQELIRAYMLQNTIKIFMTTLVNIHIKPEL